MWGRHVVGVVGQTIAEDFRKNCRAAPHGVLKFLQYKHRRTFRHHKTITRTIKRSTGEGWGVVGSRHGMNDIKSAKRERRDGCFRAAGQYHLSVAGTDQAERLPDRHGPSRAAIRIGAVW